MSADQAAILHWHWQRTAPGHYLALDGEEVIVLANCSGPFSEQLQGTRAFLVPGWSRREDFGRILELLDHGILIEADLPAMQARPHFSEARARFS